jgi:hypothetical protein
MVINMSEKDTQQIVTNAVNPISQDQAIMTYEKMRLQSLNIMSQKLKPRQLVRVITAVLNSPFHDLPEFSTEKEKVLFNTLNAALNSKTVVMNSFIDEFEQKQKQTGEPNTGDST